MVSSSVNSAVSAIRAAEQQQAVSAHNVANSNTDGYKRSVATTEEDAHGGVNVSIRKDNTPAPTYNKRGKEVEPSNVDQARETVDQIHARALFEANVESLKAYEETQETVVDMVVE